MERRNLKTKTKGKVKARGITLIALVITIIILLILAGITISSLTGENGLITKIKQGKDKYSISEAKEKLEVEIEGLRIEEERKGEELTKEDLPRLNNDEIDVGSVDSFPVNIICNKYKFRVDENFAVTYIKETDGTIVTYTTEPEGYTNKDEVKILIKVANPKGIKTIEYPDGDKLICNGKQEVGIDYKTNKNGNYIFKIIDSEDREVTKDVIIDNIDRLDPIEVNLEVTNITGASISICVDAKDANETSNDAKSGIQKFEYFIKKSSENNYIKYSSNNNEYTFDKLDTGEEYDIYVIAYDAATNHKESEIITRQTKNEKLTTLIATADGIFNSQNLDTGEYYINPDYIIDGVSPNLYNGKGSSLNINYGYRKRIDVEESAKGKTFWVYGHDNTAGVRICNAFSFYDENDKQISSVEWKIPEQTLHKVEAIIPENCIYILLPDYNSGQYSLYWEIGIE